MDRMNIVIIDDNEKFITVLDFYFRSNKNCKVIKHLTHEDIVKKEIPQEVGIAIVGVKSTDNKTLETIRVLKDKYPVKILALPLYLRETIVEELKNLKVDGIIAKSQIDGDVLLEALDQLSKGGSYYKLGA